jgi:transposase
MLELLDKGYILINIDESGLSTGSFNNKSWFPKDKTCHLSTQLEVFTTSVNAAITSDGYIYCSLLQHTNNSQTLSLFLYHLSVALDKKRPNWRDNHIILMDNAPYHKSKQFQRDISRLNIPHMFTAPYSFSASPIKLLFAFLKKGSLTNLDISLRKK